MPNYPVQTIASAPEEIAFDAEPRTDACNGVRPSCLPQAMAQIIHCGLREGRGEWLDHMKIANWLRCRRRM
jgi:hypothetical protein